MVLELQYMYDIPLTTLHSGLFIDIKHVKFTGPETKRAWCETENLKFFIYFLNKDFSLNISSICLEFSIYINEG